MTIKTTTISTEINKVKPKESEFEAPKGYNIEKTTLEEFMQKMMSGFGGK